jgi:hypothetical protein
MLVECGHDHAICVVLGLVVQLILDAQS